jgi:hypothetical protein
VRLSRATSVPVVGDANIDNQIATTGRARQVVDGLDISVLQTRARGNPLCLNLVPCGPKERTELGNHPIVRFGSTWMILETFTCATVT